MNKHALRRIISIQLFECNYRSKSFEGGLEFIRVFFREILLEDFWNGFDKLLRL